MFSWTCSFPLQMPLAHPRQPMGNAVVCTAASSTQAVRLTQSSFQEMLFAHTSFPSLLLLQDLLRIPGEQLWDSLLQNLCWSGLFSSQKQKLNISMAFFFSEFSIPKKPNQTVVFKHPIPLRANADVFKRVAVLIFTLFFFFPPAVRYWLYCHLFEINTPNSKLHVS